MRDGVVILFPEGEVKQVDSIREAIGMSEEFNKYSIEEYCKQYDLEYDDLAKGEANFASGYENGIIKIFNTNDVIKEIKDSDILKCEKDILLNKLEHSNKTLKLEDYEGLDSILETCEEIELDDHYDDI